MIRTLRNLTLLLLSLAALTSAQADPLRPISRHATLHPTQETGFLNRTLTLHGVSYRFQVYLPEEFHRADHKHWPVILFLHGRGERGSEGLWQTQVGLPQALRDHPDRWPFVVVMPQCPLANFWTDSEMLAMALGALVQETNEFQLDRDRTYLAGLSMGGYGAWELVRQQPNRWAAVAIAAGGIFWSYQFDRWKQEATLPAEYAQALGRTPLWLFHGSEDDTVSPRQSELMYDAVKANNGHVRLWLFQGLKHDSWTRAFGEPELPRWLLAHTLKTPQTVFAERLIVPLHPTAVKLTTAALDSLTGDYHDSRGHLVATLFRQNETLYEKNEGGIVFELAAESTTVFFYPNGSSLSRLSFEHDATGHVIAVVFHDDRHEERWEKRPVGAIR